MYEFIAADKIAFDLYPSLGREACTSLLIDANPAQFERVIFPAGVVLNVPDVDIMTSGTLPPWMR